MDQFVTRGPLYPERVEKTSANCNGWGEIWEPEGCAVQSWSYVETFTPENSSESCLSLVLRFFFPLPLYSFASLFSSFYLARGYSKDTLGGGILKLIEKSRSRNWVERRMVEEEIFLLFLISLLRGITFEEKG